MNSAVARCHLLAEVLSADGMMSETERDLLERTMAELDLADADRDRVRHFEGTAGAVEAVAALSDAERQAIVDGLVEAALVDGKLTPNETAAVKRITAAIGL